MIVGAAVVELRVHGSQSLKAKRGVVRSIVRRLRNRFNVAVSEVGGQGTWQRAVLGLSMVGADEVPLRRALERAVDFIEETHLAQLIGREIEMIQLPLVEGLEDDGDVDGMAWSEGSWGSSEDDSDSEPGEE